MWDPDVYLAFADHRNRPFYDLLSRVGAKRARRVVDLGCGPGHLTKYLGGRWPVVTPTQNSCATYLFALARWCSRR
jgi:trans-aconitate 2-methyltransferase